MIIYGHRGAAGEAPENTLSGFQLAYSHGIRHFELDIQLSKDDKLVVIHDTSVDRTTQFKGKVADYSFDDLTSMDARSNVKPWPTEQTIPSLESVLLACPDFEHFQFEVKTDKKERLSKLAKHLIELIYIQEIKHRVAVTSSNAWLLEEVKRRDNTIHTGLVAEYKFPNPVTTAKNLGCRFLCLKWTLATKSLVDEAHKKDLHVSTWTVNRIHDMQSLQKLGVDSIITDYPNSTLAYFENQSPQS